MGARRQWWAGLSATLAAMLALPAAPASSEAAPAAGSASAKAAKAAKATKNSVKKAKHVKNARGHKGKTVAKKPPPPPPPPLDGVTYDYDYDAADVGRPERAWLGRAFVHRKAAGTPEQALPMLVFLHGMNTEGIKYRWMGGGQEGDVRRIVAELIEAGQLPPMLVAAPSSIDQVAVGNAMTSWPSFDLDTFLDRTSARLAGTATIDRARVIVAGHSGAGCNIKGGIASALKAKTDVLAGLVIDTCMGGDLAKDLAHLRPTMNVVVSWQSQSWDSRPFDDFRFIFQREVKKAPPALGVLRELAYEQPQVAMPHDAMVGLTLKKWLPKLVPPQPSSPSSPPPSPPPPLPPKPVGVGTE